MKLYKIIDRGYNQYDKWLKWIIYGSRGDWVARAAFNRRKTSNYRRNPFFYRRDSLSNWLFFIFIVLKQSNISEEYPNPKNQEIQTYVKPRLNQIQRKTKKIQDLRKKPPNPGKTKKIQSLRKNKPSDSLLLAKNLFRPAQKRDGTFYTHYPGYLYKSLM